MSTQSDFFRQMAGILAENNGETAPQATRESFRQRVESQLTEGPYRSDVAVNPGDKNRVQVAPNVQNKVYQHDQQQQAVDAVNSRIRQAEHPKSSNFGATIGNAIGDVVAGGRAAWDAGVNAFNNKNAPIPDPQKPVDIIPDPRRGTALPRDPAPLQRPGSTQGGITNLPSRPTQQGGTRTPTVPLPQPVPGRVPPSDAAQSPMDRIEQRAGEREAPRSQRAPETNTDRMEPLGMPLESMRRLMDVVVEAEFKDITNQLGSANDLLKPYKLSPSEKE